MDKKYTAIFKSILDLIEEDTGEVYEIKINKYGCDESDTINNVSEREIEVYDMDDDYRILNRTYQSFEHLQEKMSEERISLGINEKDKTLCRYDHYGYRDDNRICGYYRYVKQ